MYERFFGLREKPFSLTPDPDFLFLTRQHRDALEQMLYGIQRREGFTVIVGDVGTGKTTLCWALLGKLEGGLRTALVLNPLLTEEEVLRAIVQDFGVPPPGSPEETEDAPDGPSDSSGDSSWLRRLGKTELIDALNRFLLERAAANEFCVLILDEAQGLSSSVLEQLRVLSNLETAKKKLLQIIFVGQVEFEEKLKLPQLRSLNQRISIRHRIGPLSRDETAEYIRYRIRVAGGSERLEFTPGAVRAIYRHSRGYPRLVNVVCDRALLAGFSETSFKITKAMVRKAVKGLGGRCSRRFAGFRSRAIGIVAGCVLLLALAALAYTITLTGLPLRGGAGSGADLPGPSQQKAAQVTRLPSVAVPESQETRLPTSDTGMPGAGTRPSDSATKRELQAQRRYYLQVHSLRTNRDADAAVQELRAAGFEALSRAEGDWQVVYVGPFAERADADAAAQRLSAQVHASAILRSSSRSAGN